MVKEKILSIGLDAFRKELNKKFYNMEYVIDALYIALTTNTNIILYGKGGYGKSQIVKAFLKFAGVNQTTRVAYEDMEVEALLGVPNIKKLTEESEYEIAFEKSIFMNEGVLVLEEFLDAHPATTAALKDILSEGGYRSGDKFIESRIGPVIICTNKSPSEVSTHQTMSALYKERFPIAVEVKWESHEYQDYINFMRTIQGDLNETYFALAELCARTSATEELISPRIVLKAMEIIEIHDDIQYLKLIPAINTSIIDEVKRTMHLRKESTKVKGISNKVDAFIKALEHDGTLTVSKLTNAISSITYLINKLEVMTGDFPENAGVILKTIQQCYDFRERLTSRFSVENNIDDTAPLDDLLC